MKCGVAQAWGGEYGMTGKTAKTVAITGGTNGIGAATVARLEAAGCAVHILDVATPATQQTGSAYIQCNLASRESIHNALQQLPDSLDAVINVAGVAQTPDPADTVAINFLGLRELSEALLPRISRGGSLVLVASSAGWKWRDFEADIRGLLQTSSYAEGKEWLTGNPNLWHQTPYQFSKRCAAAYTYIATHLAMPFGVRVNCVNPGTTETQLSESFRSIVGDRLYDWGVERVGRAGKPDDIAEVIEFLAIGNCGWLNGQELAVDGGYIAGLIGGWIDPAQAPSQAP